MSDSKITTADFYYIEPDNRNYINLYCDRCPHEKSIIEVYTDDGPGPSIKELLDAIKDHDGLH